jgi:hypothetical protein
VTVLRDHSRGVLASIQGRSPRFLLLTERLVSLKSGHGAPSAEGTRDGPALHAKLRTASKSIWLAVSA